MASSGPVHSLITACARYGNSRLANRCHRSHLSTTDKATLRNTTITSSSSVSRHYSSTPQRCYEIPSQEHLAANTQPRWRQTPKAMTMPIRLRPKVTNQEWRCNDSPEKLDAMYRRFLGHNGPELLSEETKWLAVTHKSFDQGRRGFNERLGYMGRRIVELQTSLALLDAPSASGNATLSQADQFGRIPFQHPALNGLAGLTSSAKQSLLSKQRLSHLGDQYGITRIMRWQPKKADNLLGSGIEMVTAQTIYAIVGAVALERGGEVANQLVREKILAPLGVPLSSQS